MSVNTQENIEAVKHAVLSAPTVGVTALTLCGIGLQDWVLIATLLWLGIQIGWFAYSKFIAFKRRVK